MHAKDGRGIDLIPELMAVRSRRGELTAASKEDVAQKLSLPLTVVEQAATFYPSLSAPKAKYHIRLCKSLSCHMDQSGAIYKALKKELKLRSKHVTSDGTFFLERVNCLGLCEKGPAMMINNRVVPKLTTKNALAAVRKLMNGR